MKKLITITAVLLMAGCATPQEFMQRPPDAELKLQQSPERAALCVNRNIEKEINNIISDRRPTDTGHELIVRVMGELPTLYAVAQLTAEGTGSRAKIWTVTNGISSETEVAQKMTKGC